MPIERTHYFRDENDDRTVVRTVLVKAGHYKAYVTEGLHNDLDVRGYGPSRMSAIASLNEAIQRELTR